MKIKFLTGFKPKGDAESIPSYEAGKTYDFSGFVGQGYARKYIERGLAVEVVAEAPKVKEPEPVKEPAPAPEPKVAPPVAKPVAKPSPAPAHKGKKRS
jgi:hypothetical protein